jgi:hypothetical protein
MAQRHIFPSPLEQQPEGFVSYKGGHTVKMNGYLFELCPNHPKANAWGFVQQHKLVAEDKIGRYLRPGEVVHHIDEDRANNTSDNLQVMTQAAHRKLHARMLADKQMAKLTLGMVREALQGRTIKEAAIHLGCHHQTLRNRYPGEIAHRKRKAPTDLNDPKIVALVRRLASDDQWSYNRIARVHKIAHKTVVAICKKHKIRWVRKSKVGEIHTKYCRKTSSPLG